MRRNLLIARALLRLTPRPNVLLIGGARELGALTIPEGIDCLTLPALHKEDDGLYRPRSLSISLRRIVDLRAAVIKASVSSFNPDLLIADKVPLGAFGELKPTLRWLRSRGRARCVLGLREILDEPKVARREWARDGGNDAVEAFYDEVWVYGDRRICDLASEYNFSRAVAERLVYTGYLDRSAYVQADEQEAVHLLGRIGISADTRLALCCVGGGQDGFALAQAFAGAPFPAGMSGVIITGPFMPAAQRLQLEQMAAARLGLAVAAFLEEPAALIRRADAVVSMAGYNTVCEILAFARRALLVPRVLPRCEQLIRARRLSELGLVEMFHPEELSAPAIGAWLVRRDSGPPAARMRVDMGALDRLPGLALRLALGRAQRKEAGYGD